MTTQYRVEIIDDGAGIVLSGEERPLRFHAMWLRDNALDAASRNQSNGQRLISVLDVAGDTRISEARIAGDNELLLTFAADRRTLNFPITWLFAHSYDRQTERSAGWLPPNIRLWDCDFEKELPNADYARVAKEPRSLLLWLRDLRNYGIARLYGVPCKDGAVCAVAELFGFVRETNYGRWFDVRARVDPTNLAYTGMALQAHTDNPYRDPVPTLQLLSCMQNSTEGGASIVVDGFSAARQLQKESPEQFHLLANYCARFEFAGADTVCLRSRRPVIELASDGELLCIRFNNRSAAPTVDVPYDTMRAYYSAYRRLAEIIEDAGLRVRFRLEPGELFVLDNTRVLHAREAYSAGGQRWLQGCYADKDSLLSTIAVLGKKVAL